jgi:hypothetical protein
MKQGWRLLGGKPPPMFFRRILQTMNNITAPVKLVSWRAF